MNQHKQLGLALTAVAALLGAPAGLQVGFHLGVASSDQIGPVIIGAYLGLLIGPGLSVWGVLAIARQRHAGRTAGYLTFGWVLSATISIYALPWLRAPQSAPGVLVLLVTASLAARLWADRLPRSWRLSAQARKLP